MGTHPIFESDFDCLTECPENHHLTLLVLAVSARRRQEAQLLEQNQHQHQNQLKQSFPTNTEATIVSTTNLLKRNKICKWIHASKLERELNSNPSKSRLIAFAAILIENKCRKINNVD